MLQKKYRLKKYSAFIATYKFNHIVADNNMCIYFGKEKTNSDLPTKIAFVVSKKIHKRAVVRNRIKRLMRENFRLIMKNSEFKNIYKYLSIICVAKTESVNANFNSIGYSIRSLLSNNQ